MVYLSCQPEDEQADPALGEQGDESEQDLDRVEWAGLDTVRERMPDMYPPVKAHLESVLGGLGRF
jgi:hypothetical protein